MIHIDHKMLLAPYTLYERLNQPDVQLFQCPAMAANDMMMRCFAGNFVIGLTGPVQRRHQALLAQEIQGAIDGGAANGRTLTVNSLINLLRRYVITGAAYRIQDYLALRR
jgi:hypothetical protein